MLLPPTHRAGRAPPAATARSTSTTPIPARPARFTFKRNGQYDQNGAARSSTSSSPTGGPTSRPRWTRRSSICSGVYQEVGASQPINIVSSYRSPETNAMLRAKSSGVAENSPAHEGQGDGLLHPRRQPAKLRATAMRHQVGGVGYYPTSGSPFVHVDTGSVRAWPRMTRAQLKKVFPDGKTLHLPADGKPLSDEGRRYAEAEWNKCHMVPCNGADAPSAASGAPWSPTMSATAGRCPTAAHRSARWRRVDASARPRLDRADPAHRCDRRRRRADPGRRPAPHRAAPAARRWHRRAASTRRSPRPSRRACSSPPARRCASDDGETALVALANLGAPLPQPRVLMTPDGRADDGHRLRADDAQDPGAQRALADDHRARDHRRSPPRAQAAPTLGRADDPDRLARRRRPARRPQGHVRHDLRTRSSGTAASRRAAGRARRPAPAPQPDRRRSTRRDVDLVAPDIDHVAETLVAAGADVRPPFFAEIYEAEGYLDKATELGPLTTRIGFDPDIAAVRRLRPLRDRRAASSSPRR